MTALERPSASSALALVLPDAGETGLLPRTDDAGPLPAVDEAGLLPDTAPVNSWSARIGELDPVEILETQLVNALAPALLCDRLLPFCWPPRSRAATSSM